MVKRRTKPGVHSVAILTFLWGKFGSRCEMVRYAPAQRRSALEILRMAGIARSRQPRKLADRSLLVAVIALQGGVCAHQREAVKVILNCLYGNGPPVHRMTLLAIGPELPPMNIGMAVRAFRPDVREHQLRMALNTLDFLVHTAQGIASLIVVKFRNGADGLPTGGGVAIFARNVDRPVGVPQILLLLLGRTRLLLLRRTRRTLSDGLKS